MIPPNQVCSVSCSSSGNIEIVNCGGDGSVVVKATTDDPKGVVFVTKTCNAAVPELGIVACGETSVAIPIGVTKRPVAKLAIAMAIITVLGGAGLGGGIILLGPVGAFLGGIIGMTVGVGVGFLIALIFDP